MSGAEQVDEEIEINDITSNRNTTRCLKVTLRILFSTPGLVILVIAYSVMGALIFPLLEAPFVQQSAVSISKSREDCLKELWTITERLNVLYERNWTLLVHEQLRRFEGTIVQATKGGFIETMGDRLPRWSFSEALLYSVTVITTIGHGNLTPKTSEGKIVTMLYALIGVPLMLMCLSSLGGLLAEVLQCTYSRICGDGRLAGQRHHSQNHSHQEYQTGDQEDELDCNICKYDSICKETNFQTYDKYMTVNDHREADSCQLIRNSPSKSLTTSHNQHEHHNYHRSSYQPPIHASAVQSETSSSQYINVHLKQQIPQYENNQQQQPSSPYLPVPLSSSRKSAIQNNQNITGAGSAIIMVMASTNPQTTTSFTKSVSNNPYLPTNCYHQSMANTVTTGLTTSIPNHPLNSQPLQPRSLPHITEQEMFINSKYREMQLQSNNLTTNNDNLIKIQKQHQQQQPSPQHTATVHGLGRSKFLPKPLPQEINILLSECDMNCHHDMKEITTIPPNCVTIRDDNADDQNETNGCRGGYIGAIDIDDDDDEDNRIGCPHGTPSRIPLIKHSTNEQHQIINRTMSKDNHNITETSSALNQIKKLDLNSHRHDNETDADTNDGSQMASHSQVPITLILIILISYISIGTVIFSLWENWSFIDGAYFCFVTLSTIGFGDLMPRKTFHGPELQLFACCAYLLLGLVLVAMSFSLLETQLMWKCKRMAVRLKLTKD